MSIKNELDVIGQTWIPQNASKVRQAIHDILIKTYDTASENGNANMEVEIARGTHPNLRSRLEEVDNKQKQTASQLAQTHYEATKKKTLNDIDGEFLSAIEGGEGTSFDLLSIPQPKSVTSDKTTFIRRTSTNVFNKDGVINGKTIDHASGEISDNPNIGISESYHEVKPNTDYTARNIFSVAFYDRTHSFIKRWNYVEATGGPQTFNTENAHYVRFLMRVTVDYGTVMVNEGNQILPYQPYKEEIDASLLGVGSVGNKEIKRKSVFPTTTTFIKNTSTNLFNKYGMIDGKSIEHNTGKILEHPVLGISEDYIKVEQNSDYTSRSIFGVVLYDSNYNYMRRWIADESNLQNPQTFNSEGASYIKFMVHMNMYKIAQLNKGDTILPYESSKETIDSHLIVPEKNIDGSSGVQGYSQIEVHTNSEGFSETVARDYNLYPNRLVWGHEYMYSWYEKVMNDDSLKMVWAGDSTTAGGSPDSLRRHALGKKIMTLGGYQEELITSINAGNGGKHTGNWLGGEYNDGAFNQGEEFNYLEEDMAENPDLYVFGYGVNDGSPLHHPDLTVQERVDRFERNLNIGLERIRGQYGKTADDMAIILTTPVSTSVPHIYPEIWHNHIKRIMHKAARDYHCAFVDIAGRQYDHAFSRQWSIGRDRLHPTGIANADYMSLFSDLIYPYLMHKD